MKRRTPRRPERTIDAKSQIVKFHRFLKETMPLVESLDNTNWDQEQGTYIPGEPACIGAHIAHFAGHDDADDGADDKAGLIAAAIFVDCDCD